MNRIPANESEAKDIAAKTREIKEWFGPEWVKRSRMAATSKRARRQFAGKHLLRENCVGNGNF